MKFHSSICNTVLVTFIKVFNSYPTAQKNVIYKVHVQEKDIWRMVTGHVSYLAAARVPCLSELTITEVEEDEE